MLFFKKRNNQVYLINNENLPIDFDLLENKKEFDNKECYISKEFIYKITPFHWYIDIDAFLYIFNQLSFFKDIKKIKKKIIKVNGEVIYCNRINIAIIELENNGMILFTRILYILGLEVNFFFNKKIYEARFKNRFNTDYIYFRKNEMNIIKVKMKKGIYMIFNIVKGFENIVL